MKQPRQASLARSFRHRPTEAERMLWRRLRNAQLDGVKFRRQQPMGKYIVDFISFDRKLIIEIDGGQHNMASGIEKDARRTEWLESEGFRVIRFWSNDVITNAEGILSKIEEVLGSIPG